MTVPSAHPVRPTALQLTRPHPQAAQAARPAAKRLRHLLKIFAPMEFERAQSFDDLLAANARFLRGELHGAPYCSGLAGETSPLLASLELLHGPSHRYFTFESQPGLREVRWVEPWVNARCGITGGNAYVETEQRVSWKDFFRAGDASIRSVVESLLPYTWWVLAIHLSHPATDATLPAPPLSAQAYVDMFVEAERLPSLLARLRRHAPSLSYFVDLPGRPDVYTAWGIPEGKVWTCTSGWRYLNLTRSRSAPTKAGLASAPWKLYTNALLHPGWADEEVELLAEASPALAPKLQRCALVAVMATRYGPPAEGEPSLLDVLLEAASAEGEAEDVVAGAAGQLQLVCAELME